MIWKKSLPQKALFERKPAAIDNIPENGETADIAEAAKKYELTGGSILNVVHYAGIKAVEKLAAARTRLKENAGRHVSTFTSQTDEHLQFLPEPRLIIYLTDILDGIRREMIKEGKPFSL